MFSMKKAVMATLLMIAAVFSAAPAMAILEPYEVEITISDLGAFNLGAFDIDVSYDNSLLTFISYSLTEELGTLDGIEASDWSGGDDGLGTVNLSVFSWLNYNLYADFFSNQANDFTLGTVYFTGDESSLAAISLSYVDLSDEYGDAIPFTVDGTNISAVSAVPVPGAIWLAMSGLLGCIGVRRRARS